MMSCVAQFHGMGLGFWNIFFSSKSRFRHTPATANNPGYQSGPWGAGTLPYTEGDNESIYLFHWIWGKAMPSPNQCPFMQ